MRAPVVTAKVSGREDEDETEGCEMCVTPWPVGDLRLSGDLKVRQYVCSGVREEGRAVNLTWAMGWTSAAMICAGCGTGVSETWCTNMPASSRWSSASSSTFFQAGVVRAQQGIPRATMLNQVL